VDRKLTTDRYGTLAAPLRLALLGPAVVESDGLAASFDTRKATALLALLAATGAEQSRERLAGLFWPDAPDSRARSSLRRTLSVTSSAVGPALIVSRGSIALDRAATWCDVWEFERLAANGDLGSLGEAADLYRDDFLAGFVLRGCPEFDDWQRFVAEDLRQRFGAVLAALVAARIAVGKLEAALSSARRWLALDPLHEPAHQTLMRLYAWTDQRAAALRQYRNCVRVLERELGVTPLSETTSLYQDIRAARLPAPVPASASAPDKPAPGDGTAQLRGASRPSAEVPALLGQEEVMSAVLAAVRSVGPAGRVIGLQGAAGSGKTRIIEELRLRLATSGGTVITARCHEGEAGLALGIVTELLRSALVVAPGLASHIEPYELAELSRLVPALEPPPHEARLPPLDTPGAQVRFYRAVGAALARALAGPAAGIAVIEDLQWADDASARLVAFLIRRLEDLPIVLLLSWQSDTGPPAALTGALAELAKDGRASLVTPRPLGIEAIAELLASSGVTGVAPAEVLAETQGLALLVTAYVEALHSSSDLGDGRAWQLPTSARELLASRVSVASETTAQVLAAAAVLGGRGDAELLRATSGRGEAEVADALDEAMRRGLLVEQSDASGADPAYDFPYTALRRVVYETIGTARRRLLHGRAADTLARGSERDRSSAAPAAVAAHLREAGRADEAFEWSWRAALRAQALYAHAEALLHLRTALELGHAAPEGDVRGAIGASLIALGRYDEALVELERSAAIHDPDDPALAGIEHRLAEIHHRLGDWPAAAAHLDAALELAGDDPVLRARVEADLALVAYRCNDAGARKLANAALRQAKAADTGGAAGGGSALAHAHNVVGVLAAAAGDTPKAEASLRASLDQAGRLEDSGPKVAALNNLARLLAESGRLEEALATADEALRLGTERGDVHRMAALHSNLADLLHAAGDEAGALAHLKTAAGLFAAIAVGGEQRPRIWTLVEW
jgi:DNA-binding SARP family transcriptional activator/tetratricopeptide (TPR) repeat protein